MIPFSFSGWRLSALSLAWLGLEQGGERLSAGGGGAFFPFPFLSLVLGTGLDPGGEGRAARWGGGRAEEERQEEGRRWSQGGLASF